MTSRMRQAKQVDLAQGSNVPSHALADLRRHPGSRVGSIARRIHSRSRAVERALGRLADLGLVALGPKGWRATA